MAYDIPPHLVSDRFSPPVDTVYISADKDKKSFRGGLQITTNYSPHATENATQDGIVVHIPLSVSDKYPLEISEGDHVYTHHFLCDSDTSLQLNGEFLYPMDYRWHIFCKIVDGEPVMIRDWNLIEPYNDTKDYRGDSGLYLTASQGHSGKYGIAKYINKELRNTGIKEGDLIVFNQDSDYPIEVEGELLFRMRNRDIDAVITSS